MKQYISILAALLLCLSASTLKAQIVNIPDPVFKNYLLSTGVNANLDFEVQLSEAQNYTGTLNLIGQNITDLTGLEEFINLTQLYCQSVPVTSLDLSTNIMLTHLHCELNLFTTLDLSNNVNLTNVICNQLKITSLDLSSNINLVAIDCRQDSFLTLLNVKNGNNTIITSFMANSNPNLSCIEVDDSVYSTTNWVNIDATANFSNNCFYLVTSDIYQDIPNLQVYPNPTPNALTVDLGTIHSSVNITILNTIGQSLQSSNYSNTQMIDLNIEGLPGWYFIQIETKKGSQTIKVLKQ